MSVDQVIHETVSRLVDERLSSLKEELRAELGLKVHEADAYMTTREAATYLKVSEHTLNMFRSTGGGPVFSQGVARGRVQYKRSDLDDWQSGRKRRNNQGRGRAG